VIAQNQLKSRRSSLSRALIVTRRELKDILKDWRVVTPVVILVVVLPFVLASVLSGYSDYLVKQLTDATYYEKVLPFSMLAIGFLPMSFCLVIALETFVGEKERNSLEALMSVPLTDMELYMGKYIAAVIPTLIASITASPMFWLFMSLNGEELPIPLELALTFMALNGTQAFVMVAGALLVSTHSTSVRAANIMASFIILPMSIIVQLEAVLLLFDLKQGMYFLLAALLIVLIIMFRAGVRIFNREDIVAREGDNFTFKSLLRSFGYYFVRTPYEAMANKKTGQKWSIWRFYTKDIPQIIWLNRWTSLIIFGSMIVAIGIGYWISGWEQLGFLRNNPEISGSVQPGVTIPLCEPRAQEALNLVGFGEITWQRIFLQNVLATGFFGGLGLLTLGISGILILMVSVGPAGGIAGFLSQWGVNPLPLLVGFLLPHGIIELPVVIIGIAAGMTLGLSLIAPPKGLNIGQSFQLAFVNYIKIQGFIIPLLFVAAIIEANFTASIGCWLTGGKF
jgi:uncharacterized membrane protein SpoIIM required for sporulation/ABC-type transport system involved in cytochrome c biogenesis permease component